MNAKTKQAVREIIEENLRDGTDCDSIMKEVARVIDTDITEALVRTMEFGELLEAVGLHIVPK